MARDLFHATTAIHVHARLSPGRRGLRGRRRARRQSRATVAPARAASRCPGASGQTSTVSAGARAGRLRAVCQLVLSWRRLAHVPTVCQLVLSWRRLAHVPTLMQVHAMAHLDGREPFSYLFDGHNYVPELRLESENPLGRHALCFTGRHPDSGRRFELVTLSDGCAFDLLGMSG